MNPQVLLFDEPTAAFDTRTSQLEADVGPCLVAYRTGKAVLVDDLNVDPQRWPAFAERAAEYDALGCGVCVAAAITRRTGRCVEPVFAPRSAPCRQPSVAIGQALAKRAAIGILHQRILTHSEVVNQQLQSALNTRVIIEQAKGVIAERGSVDMDGAFGLLRSYARGTQQRLADLARAVVEGADATAILHSDSS